MKLKAINIPAAVKFPVRFKYYRDSMLYYTTEMGDIFAVPLHDLGNASVNAEEKGIMLMRYMRKHNEMVKEFNDGKPCGEHH